MKLKDGTESEDARLDRLVQFDERSRNFPIRTVVSKRPRGYSWRITPSYVIDQGQEGACVGFAVANELIARPAEVDFKVKGAAQAFARRTYWDAQKIDPWPGGAYPGASPFYEGTSVLAGVKAAREEGYFEEYRWAFGIQDLVLGLGHNGPAVLGISWYDSMYRTNSAGFISPRGRVVGGHAILVRAVSLVWKRKSKSFTWWTRTWEDVDLDKSFVTLRNSWGPGFGRSGDCFITLRDLDVLLKDRGEAVFLLKRKSKLD